METGMLVYQPSKYLDFITYCNKRKKVSKYYKDLKMLKSLGAIKQPEYVSSLRSLHQQLIELELQYFDILSMRL